MSSNDRERSSDLALFASLYALQGVVIAYFFSFNPLYMIASGVPKEEAAGIQSLALLPFILKFLGGPVSDRINFFGWGHRKPYILLGLVVQTLGLIGLAALNPFKETTAFTVVAILTVAGLALYDTCCDGMVIDTTPADERSRVQGVLVAARAIAAMVCSLAFGLLLDEEGNGTARYQRVLLVCAWLGVIPLVLGLRCRDPRRLAEENRFQWAAFRVMILPSSLVLLAFGALYSIVGYGVEINLSSYYQSMGFDHGDIGLFASVRNGGRAVGATLLSLASRRMGRGSVLMIGLFLLAISTASQAWVGGSASALAFGFGFGIANGWNDAIFFVMAMEASDPRMAASTYALFMAITNVCVTGGWGFSKLETALGGRYSSAFLASAALCLLPLVLVPPLARTSRKSPVLHDVAV